MCILQISPSLNIADELSYRYSGESGSLNAGARVVVPVGPRLVHGWITNLESSYKGRVKNIIALIEPAVYPTPGFLRFVREASLVYLSSQGLLLDSAAPPSQKNMKTLWFRNPENNNAEEKWSAYSSRELIRIAGKTVLTAFFKGGGLTSPLLPDYRNESVGDNTDGGAPPRTALLAFHREKQYMGLIQAVLNQGKPVLLITPENLSAAHYARELAALSPELFHSGVKPKERDRMWREYVREKKTGLIIGGLSALLLPIPTPGLIIVDRAGSPSYANHRFSKYDLQTLARLRAEYEHIPLVEAGAAPVLDVFRLRDAIRVDDFRSNPPPIEVRRIEPKTQGLPPQFPELVRQYLDENKKILVLLNYKESRRFLYCDKCRSISHCPSCGGFPEVSEDFSIHCPRCGLERANFNTCSSCGRELLPVERLSISSVKTALQKRIPESAIMSVSSEGLADEHLNHLLRRIEDSSVVIATLALINPCFYRLFDSVIFLRPESRFDLDEYDAARQIFAIAHELRELTRDSGSVDIFSAFAFHYALKLLNDETLFADRELKYREWFHLPPFYNIYHIEIREKEPRRLGAAMRDIYSQFREKLNIRKIYLSSRKAERGVFKGIMEARALPETIAAAGLQRFHGASVSLELN